MPAGPSAAPPEEAAGAKRLQAQKPPVAELWYCQSLPHTCMFEEQVSIYLALGMQSLCSRVLAAVAKESRTIVLSMQALQRCACNEPCHPGVSLALLCFAQHWCRQWTQWSLRQSPFHSTCFNMQACSAP